MTSALKEDDVVMTDIDRLRVALLGDDIKLLEEANRQLNDQEAFAKRLAEGLNDAVVINDSSSNKFTYSLRDPVLKSLALAAQTRPDELSKSLAPIIGKAVVSAVADAMRGINEQIEIAYTKAFTAKGLKWRFESWRTGEPYSRIAMRSSHGFQIQQVAYLSKRQGKLLATTFGKGVIDERKDNSLDKQQALLENIALNRQITNSAEEIKAIEIGDKQMFAAHAPWSTLVVVYWGQPPADLATNMLNLINALERNYSSDLKKFKADVSPFESTQPLLKELFDSAMGKPNKRAEDRPKNTTSMATWFTLVGLLLLCWFVYLFLNYQQKSALEKNLATQPGFVLTNLDGNVIQGWKIKGLADPQGFNAKSVIDASKLQEDKVSFDVMPFISLAPAVVLARAKAKLNPPSTVTLALEDPSNNMLTVTGESKQEWLTSAMPKMATIIGVDKVDTTKLTILKAAEPVAITKDTSALVSFIDAQQIQFADADHFESGQDAVIDQLASKIIELSAAAQKSNQSLMIDILGHATADGTLATNKKLQESRAIALVSALLQRGVDAKILQIKDEDSQLDAKTATLKVNSQALN